MVTPPFVVSPRRSPPTLFRVTPPLRAVNFAVPRKSAIALPAGVDVERVRAADRRLARLAVRRTVAVPVAVATRIVAELGACNDGRQCERSQERDDFA